MDSKEQVVLVLKNENDYLKRENEFLKKEFIRLFGSFPTMDGSNIIQTNGLMLPNINQSQSRRDNDELGISVLTIEKDLERYKQDASKAKKDKETIERQNINLKNENEILVSKLNNLETVFIGSNIIRNKDGTVTNDLGENYSMSAVRVIVYV
jgi:hypothetical protein